MSDYVIKLYADFKMFMLGRIDFATLSDRAAKSIDQNRYAALYTAFSAMDTNLPTDMILGTTVAAATKDEIIEQIEDVKAATGRDIMLIGARPAVQKLQNLVTYNMFSDDMKNEQHLNGQLAKWEGYDCVALSRVNAVGTRTSVFSADDNKKIYIIPVDPEFKPIKLVQSGDIEYIEAGMDGNGNMDRTASIDIRYEEGVGVVINQIFGEIKFTA